MELNILPLKTKPQFNGCGPRGETEIYLRELVGGVGDEHAGLSDGSVAHNHALDRLGRELLRLHFESSM